MVARSSSMPRPFSDDVTMTCGNAAGCLPSFAAVSVSDRGQLVRLDLVGLGQHGLIGDGGLVEDVGDLQVGRLQAVARIDQQEDARQRRAALADSR